MALTGLGRFVSFPRRSIVSMPTTLLRHTGGSIGPLILNVGTVALSGQRQAQAALPGAY